MQFIPKVESSFARFGIVEEFLLMVIPILSCLSSLFVELDVPNKRGSWVFQLMGCNFVSDYQPNGQAPISSTEKPLILQLRADGVELNEYSTPRRLTAEEIPDIVNEFRIAAVNAIEAGDALISFLFSA